MSAQQTAFHGNSNERLKGIRESFTRWPGTFEDYYQLTQKLLALNSIEDALHALVEVIVPTGVNSVTLLLAGGPADDRRLEVAAAWDQSDEPLLRAGSRFSADERLLQVVSTSRECVVINNLITDDRVSEYLRSVLLDGDAIALVALPLRSEQAFFGAILIDRSETRAFKSEEIELYQASVDLAQGTIERLWLLQETKQAFGHSAALYQISQRLLASQSIDDILHTVVDSELFGAVGGTIALLDPPVPAEDQDPELVFWAAAGASSEDILGLRVPLSKGVVGWVVRENQPAMVPDAYSDERFYAQIDQDIAFRTQSILCAPLRVDGRVIGAIELVDVSPKYLREEGVYLLGQVADQAALLIHIQRLLEETQRQARELSLLLDVSQEITASTELHEALDRIASRVLDLVHADGCHVFLTEASPEGEERLVPVVSSHYDADRILDTPLKIGQGVSGRVAETGEGLIANRVDLDPRAFHVPGTAKDPENLICVPLVSESRTIGVMTISRSGDEGFRDSDLHLASALSGQAAIILEKARHLQDAQQHSQKLAALNAVVSTASQSLTMDETLHAILEQVTALMPASAGLVCLVEPPDGSLRLVAHRGLPDSVVAHLQRSSMRDTLCDLSAHKGTTFVITDLNTWKGEGRETHVGTAALVEAGLGTYVGTPLVAQGGVLGTLGLFGREPGAFSASDVELVTAIGQQVGILVRNAQLFGQTQQALKNSTALYTASQGIANTSEIENALQIALDELVAYTGVDQGHLILFEEDRATGRIAAHYGPKADHASARIPVKGNLWYQTLRDRGQALLIRDMDTDPLAAAGLRPLLEGSVRSTLLVPLIVQNRPIGVISLATSVERAFSQAEISFCQMLADRAALAVENRRLFAQTFSSLQETTLLYQAGRRLTQARDLDGILAAITDNLPSKQIDQCWIVLREPTHEEQANGSRFLEIEALWDHEADRSLLKRRFTAQELPLLFGTHPNTTWVANDLQDETSHALDRQTAATLRSCGVKSALIAPLKTAEIALGWLLLLAEHHTQVFDPDQIRPYQTLADQAAVAIHNQQLLQRIQESLAEVETVHREYLRTQWTRFLEARRDRPTAVTFDRGALLTTENLRQLAPAQPDADSGAALVAPLKVRGQVVGALGLEDPDNGREWTAEELQMVQEIADRVAQAVENARLLEETQTSLAETERLYKATGSLSDADTADKVLAILTQEIQSALGEEYSGIVLRAGPDPSGRIDWLEACAQWHGGRAGAPGVKRVPLSQHQVLKNLVGKRRPMILRSAEAGLETPSGSRDGTVFSIPLVAGNSWLGVINISSRSRPSPDARTLRFLQNLADRSSIALESVRLYEETQRRAVQLEAAARVSRAATSILDQEKLLSNVVALVRNYFDYHYAQIFLLDPTEHRAVLEASSRDAGEGDAEDGYTLDLEGDSLVGRVARTGHPSILAGPQEGATATAAHESDAVGAQLAVPIRIGGRVIGVLDVQGSATGTFGPDDIAVLSTLADQLAIAIENARLYQEQLKTAEKLREVDRLKTQFLANMSHELRTPLNSIIGFSRVILKGIDGPVTDLQKQDLTAIYNSGQLLLRLINDVLDISKIAAGKMELSFEETNLKEIIDGVMMTSRALVKEKPDIELRQQVPDNLPTVIADATRMRQVLLNLMSNAVKFTVQGHVQLDADCDDQYVTIRVSDTGIGIPEEKFDLIFQEFEQVDGSTTRSAGGTGLGLPISRHFVEMHGGRMWLESRVGVGSTFFVEIPIRGPHAPEEPKPSPNPEDILNQNGK